MPVAQKLRCQVERITDHGGQVYSLDLLPERPAPRFLPGQFLHLAIDPYDPASFWPDSRVFSIASSPDERRRLRITYAVKGRFTARMAAEIQPGGALWVKLPYGDFVIHADTDVALLAGGTGVTAFTAFLAGLPVDFPHAVHLLYGARTRDLLIYRDRMECAAQANPALHCWYYFEQGQPQSSAETLGLLSVEAAMRKLAQPLHAHYYLSGPPAMLKKFTQDLMERSIPPDQIHVDAWE